MIITALIVLGWIGAGVAVAGLFHLMGRDNDDQ